MTIYDHRPWLKCCDPGVTPDFPAQNVTCQVRDDVYSQDRT